MLINTKNNDSVTLDLTRIETNTVAITHRNVEGMVIENTNHKLTSINLNEDFKENGLNQTAVLDALIFEKYTKFTKAENDWISPVKIKRFIVLSSAIIWGKSRKSGRLGSESEAVAFDEVMSFIRAVTIADPDVLMLESDTCSILYADSIDSQISESVQRLINLNAITEQDKPV